METTLKNTHNRTYVELKLSAELTERLREVAHNRTYVELKLFLVCLSHTVEPPHNRTYVELKHVSCDDDLVVHNS